ncbi:hypothetical protein DRJ16_07530 [Candidatus Woesearchaeota archaeon]|nr:MAG: hypothetical protein DRJ16_07530 [Candidatus Woesearchaeota archaeon]
MVDVYAEGEALAEMAVKEGVARKQLTMLRDLSQVRDKRGIRNWIRRQTARGVRVWSYEFGRRLEEVLDKCPDTMTFSRIMGIAAQSMYWVECEPIMSALYEVMPEIKRVLREYSGFKGYGDVDVRIYGKQLTVFFEKVRGDLGSIARDIAGLLRRSIPSLRNLRFTVYIRKLEGR